MTLPPGHELSGLMKWTAQGEWRSRRDDVQAEHFAPAVTEFGLDFGEIGDALGGTWGQTLWGCAFEDFLTRRFDPGAENPVEAYMRRNGWKESALARGYMTALQNSVMSLYEASDIVPGASFRARDLIRGGEPVLVSEHTATRMLKPWDRIAGRIVPQGPRMVLSGGLLSFTLEASQALFAQLRDRYAHVIRGARIAAPSLDALAGWAGTDADLQRAAPLFTTAWLFDMLLRALGINRPTVVNSDGDEVVFHTVTFSIRLGASREEIARRLGGVRELQQESGTFWNWVAQTSLRPAKPRGAESRARAAIWNITTEDGGVVLGNVELKPRTVVLSVSSAARAEGGKDILSATLADLVGPPRIEIRTVEQMLAEARPDRKKAAARIPREVETGLVHAALDRQYRALLDEPVPMLGNMSPRAAARSAQGRKNVAAWLKHLENSSGNTTDQSDPVATYDFAWLWQELNVERLRN